jgi:hypothetical protein
MPFARVAFSFATALLSGALFLGVPGGGANAKCHMKSPDTSISGLKLTDTSSAVQVVGSGAELTESEDDLPHARFVTTNGSQELVLYTHYGADTDEYAEAEVRVAGSEALALKDLPLESFKSGRGVELGMTVEQVEALFGTCLKSREKKGPELFIEYEIDGADRDPELKDFGYPVYYAEYEFKNSKLVRYRFGFAYP